MFVQKSNVKRGPCLCRKVIEEGAMFVQKSNVRRGPCLCRKVM